MMTAKHLPAETLLKTDTDSFTLVVFSSGFQGLHKNQEQFILPKKL